MIYEIVDNSDEEQYYSLGFFTDEEEAIKAFDECNEPSDFGSPVDADEVGQFEIREHKKGWGSYYKVVKKVAFTSKYNGGGGFIWVKS